MSIATLSATNPKVNQVKEALQKAIHYDVYKILVDDMAENNTNSGPEKTEALANYTKLNSRRMKRWDKTLKVPESVEKQLEGLSQKITWLVITESWCGDAAPSLPVMNKMANQSLNLEVKLVFRDENPELMDAFLTNGSRSIPKLIMYNEEAEEILGEWGPRSKKATTLVKKEKKSHGKLRPEFKEELQQFYNKDKGEAIFEDLSQLLALI